ncbi:MAG TPA: glycosyltransferase family 2 protein [Gammaproteobacteria bacterium]|jgi:glycosyltransferase involved in cell wall biosynthesis
MGLQLFAIACCGFWVYAALYMQRSAARMPLLREVNGPETGVSADWPLVSVIVPACNEAEHLATALKSLLALDYPSLEVVVVNDRSTDSTGAVIDEIAASDSRVRAIHVETLPAGWLGKVHAMHSGVEVARGDWLLFTDADVRFEPAALKLAIGYASTQRLDHLTCMPEVSASRNFWLEVTIRAFFMLFSVSARLADVNRDNSKWPIGLGAFNLVRRALFRRTPGFEWLRMEPADDLALGAMLKRAGARSRLVHGEGMLSVPWYESMRDMVHGLEKNSFGPSANYRFSLQLLIVSLLLILAGMPVVSLGLGLARPDVVLIGAWALASLAVIVVAALLSRGRGRELLAYLCLPAGLLIMSWIMLRSAYICQRNDGIDWRGTHYSIAELRSGRRVSFTRTPDDDA